MTKKYLYTSDALQQLSHAEQERLFPAIEFDLIVFERSSTGSRPHRAWNGLLKILRNGDLLAIASPSVFSYTLPMLNKQLCKLLVRGIKIQLGVPNLTISPSATDHAFQLILAYDAQMRTVMSLNVKEGVAASVRGGRPSRLTADQLPRLREAIADQTLTMNDITKEFQVSRSTIYSFLKKHEGI